MSFARAGSSFSRLVGVLGRDGFDELYRKSRARVLGFACGELGLSRDHGEEILHQAIRDFGGELEAFRLKGNGEATTWVFRMAFALTRDFLRRGFLRSDRILPGPELHSLVEAFGEQEFVALLEDCRNEVARDVRKLGLPEDSVEEIVLQGMREFERNLESFLREKNASARRWICRTARFRALDLRRRQTEVTRDEEFWSVVEDRVRVDEPDAGALERIMEALDAIQNPKYKRLLLLDVVAEKPTHKKIVAEVLDISVDAVGTVRKRAREAFRLELEALCPELTAWRR